MSWAEKESEGWKLIAGFLFHIGRARIESGK